MLLGLSISWFLLFALHTVLGPKQVHIYHVCVESASLALYTCMYMIGLEETCFQYIWCLARYTYVIRVEPTSTSSILHHIATLAIILLCYQVNMHEFALFSLFLTSISTPFLALSKMLRFYKYETRAQYAFFTFTLLFVLSRVIAFPIFLSWRMFTLDTSRFVWIASNILINGIYGMQLYWLKRISEILVKHILARTGTIGITS